MVCLFIFLMVQFFFVSRHLKFLVTYSVSIFYWWFMFSVSCLSYPDVFPLPAVASLLLLSRRLCILHGSTHKVQLCRGILPALQLTASLPWNPFLLHTPRIKQWCNSLFLGLSNLPDWNLMWGLGSPELYSFLYLSFCCFSPSASALLGCWTQTDWVN